MPLQVCIAQATLSKYVTLIQQVYNFNFVQILDHNVPFFPNSSSRHNVLQVVFFYFFHQMGLLKFTGHPKCIDIM